MTKSVFLSLMVAATIAAGSLISVTGRCGEGARSAKSGRAADETYQVLKIGDEYKVVASHAVNDEKKHAADDYKTKVKEWQDARKTDPTLKKPVAPLVRPIGPKFNTQKGAQDYIDNKLLDGGDSKADPAKKT